MPKSRMNARINQSKMRNHNRDFARLLSNISEGDKSTTLMKLFGANTRLETKSVIIKIKESY